MVKKKTVKKPIPRPRPITPPAEPVDEITRLATKMRSLGILRMKTQHVELELHPSVFVQTASLEIDPKMFADPLNKPATEDEVLFWSAGGAGRINADGTAFAAPMTGEGLDG